MNSPDVVKDNNNPLHSNMLPSDVIATALEQVEAAMHKVVSSDVGVLHEASEHILSAGGKRVRPRLLLLSFFAIGGKDFQPAIDPAAALELVHTASVVHDDINDHGVMRRGRPSINKLWGRTFALLTGDFLFTKVYELMAPYGDLNIIFSEATTALVEGETLQAVAVKENNFSATMYMDIIARKTAALFEVGAAIGANLANASPEQIAALRSFGYNTGLAFQIFDDILDIIGDEEQLGKTTGLDLQQGKGIGSVNGNNTESNSEEPNPLQSIKHKLLDGDRLERAQTQANELINAAIMSIEILPDTAYKDELVKFAKSIINRSN